MAETVKINIATVGADQAAKQTKTLKEQIKDLRNELAGLAQGTDEYNQKVQELGNLMHQNQEITEQAKIATQDYGQQLNNLSTIASGVVGSITAVQGVMNLLGTENEDATKAIKTMTSLMGIIQGLSALESFEKTMGRMWTDMKKLTTVTREHTQSLQQNSTAAKGDAASLTAAATATKAQGVAAVTTTKATNMLSLGFRKLGLAIKSFMMSNPFTLILVAVTAIYTIVSNIIDKQRQATEEMEKQKQKIRDINLEYGLSQNGSTGYNENELRTLGRGNEAEIKKKNGYARHLMLDPNDDDITKRYNKLYSDWKGTLQKMEEAGNKFTDSYKTNYRTFLDSIEQMQVGYVNWLTKEIDRINNLTTDDYKGTLGERRRALEADQKLVEGYTNELEKYYQKLGENYQAWHNYITDFNKDEKQLNENQKKADESKKQQRKQDQLNELKDQLSYELLMNERAYKANEISLEEYNDKAIEIRNNYLERLKKWIKRWGENEKDYKLTIEQTNDQIIANERATLEEILRIRELENDPTNAINTRNAQQSVEEAKKAAEARKKSEDAILAQSVEYAEKANELYNASMIRKMILIEKWGKAELDAQHQIEMQLLNDQMEAQREQEQQLEQTYQQQIADQEAITQAKSDALDEQYTNGLMSEQAYLEAIEQLWIEHYNKLDEMEAEHITNRAEIQEEQANTMLEIQQKEFDFEKAKWEERKTLVQNYYNAFTQIVSGIQGLLTELQGAYKEDSKEYENIAEANIIISGITGALEAFQSAMSLGFPYNLIVGGIMSGISIATTTAALANLKSKKLSSGAQKASINYSPYETISTETGANIEGNIGDTRVTVLESDITETTDRVNVAESEATF